MVQNLWKKKKNTRRTQN